MVLSTLSSPRERGFRACARTNIASPLAGELQSRRAHRLWTPACAGMTALAAAAIAIGVAERQSWTSRTRSGFTSPPAFSAQRGDLKHDDMSLFCLSQVLKHCAEIFDVGVLCSVETALPLKRHFSAPLSTLVNRSAG